MKRVTSLFIALLLLAISGCSSPQGENKNNSSDNDFFTEAAKITSSQLETIESGDTYRGIINKIGKGKDYNEYISETVESSKYIYLVDDTYLFYLSFESPDDVSTKSGKDYIKDLRPAFLPSKFSKFKAKGYLYGVFVDDSLICVGNNSEYFKFIGRYANYSLSDGTSASYKDLTDLDCLLVKVDVIMETYPPQLKAQEVIIIR